MVVEGVSTPVADVARGCVRERRSRGRNRLGVRVLLVVRWRLTLLERAHGEAVGVLVLARGK